MPFEDKKYFYNLEIENALLFESKLNALGIEIKHNSDLYKIGCKLLDYQEKNLNPNLINEFDDIRPSFIEIAGYINLINKLLPFIESDYQRKILPHLQLLTDSSILQNTESKVSDQGSNKLLELYIASLCYPIFSKIELDNPKNSDGLNPDVTFYYRNRKWGIACKVLHSYKAQSIYDNIKKGIDQINKSDVDYGLVLLSLKNLIDYDAFWPILNKEDYDSGKKPEFAAFQDYDEVNKMAEEFIMSFKNKFEKEIGSINIIELFKNSKSIKTILLLTEFSTGVFIEGTKGLTFLGFITHIDYEGISQEVEEVISLINNNIA